jgi:hypothetical protein
MRLWRTVAAREVNPGGPRGLLRAIRSNPIAVIQALSD